MLIHNFNLILTEYFYSLKTLKRLIRSIKLTFIYIITTNKYKVWEQFFYCVRNVKRNMVNFQDPEELKMLKDNLLLYFMV